MGDEEGRGKKYTPDSAEVEAQKKRNRAEHNKKRLEAERSYVLGRDDYYARLGVAKSASSGEIKKAYRALCSLFHPDKVDGDKTNSTKILQELNTAYEALGNAEKRAIYDISGVRGVKNEERRRQEEDLNEKTRQEQAANEAKRTFARWANGWFDDRNLNSAYGEAQSMLKSGRSLREVKEALEKILERRLESIPDSERANWREMLERAIKAAKIRFDDEQAAARHRDGAGAGGAYGGAGDPGRGGNAGERARREYAEKKRAFDTMFDGWTTDTNKGSLFRDTLEFLESGHSLYEATLAAKRDFDLVFSESGLSASDRPDYIRRMNETLERVRLAYRTKQAQGGAGAGGYAGGRGNGARERADRENAERERALREAEAKKIKDFTARFDGWMTKNHPDSLFVENWEKLKDGVPLADVVYLIRQELAEGFSRHGIPTYLQGQFKKRVEEAILELQRDFQFEQERERKRVKFRSRADQFIKDSPGYVQGELKKVDVSEDITAFVAQLKALSLEVLNGMITEYPELTLSEVQKYREDLERSIASTVAEAKRAKLKEKGREAFEAWFSGVEEAAYQALKGGEAYSKVFKRIGEEVKGKTADISIDKQEKYVKKAEDAVDRAFLRNEKEKKTEYAKWSKSWFENLRATCEPSLDDGITPDVVKSELRRIFESKVGILPREEDRKAEIRNFEMRINAVIAQWQAGPGKEKAASAGERARGEKAAAEAWLSEAEGNQKIYGIFKSGMRKEEVEQIARAILRNKMSSLSEADQKPYLDRLATLIDVESARYEQDKRRAEFEAWVRPWLLRLAGSCRSWLEGRKFEGGNWVPLNQKYDPDKVRAHVRNTLADKLALIPKSEHAAYTERVEEIIAAAITLDAWKETIPELRKKILANGRESSQARKDINAQLESLLAMIPLDQHIAYRKSIDEELIRLENLDRRS